MKNLYIGSSYNDDETYPEWTVATSIDEAVENIYKQLKEGSGCTMKETREIYTVGEMYKVEEVDGYTIQCVKK